MIKVDCPVRAVSPGDDGRHYFFGYYDKCPWSADESYLLAHQCAIIDRFPTENDPATVGLIDKEGAFHPLTQTRAWNWQQGSQLQWLAAGGANPGIAFNDRRGGRLVTVVLDAKGREQRVLDRPVYTVSSDGKTALTLEYGRLSVTRAEYGYPGLVDPSGGEAMPKEDGIYRLDMESGKSERLITTREIASHKPNAMGDGAMHYINHLMFNPSGGRFCFLHRFERPDGITHSRFFTLGVDGKDLRLLMEGFVAHFSWRDDQTILAWGGKRSLLGTGKSGKGNPLMTLARRGLKPIYYALGKPRFLMNRILKDSFLLIPDQEPSPTQVFAHGSLTCDGHCTYSPDRRWVLTDGYPDLKNRQPLFLWNAAEGRGYEIGRYFTPKHLDKEVRVDLHPRFNRSTTKVCIDSAMDGTRRMYVVDVSGLTQAKGS